MGFFDAFKKKDDKFAANDLTAFVSGKVVPISEVPDPVFSEGTMGEGFAIWPSDEVLVSPADAQVTVTMDGSFHAICLKLANEAELLLHIGVDTVDMKGSAFSSDKKVDQKVKRGDVLIKFNREKIKAAGHADCVICVVSEMGKAKGVQFSVGAEAVKGETVVAHFE